MGKKISKKYVEKINEEKINNRIKTLKYAAEIFEKALPAGYELVSHNSLMRAVVLSHFLDVERFKDFHCEPADDPRITYEKVAAFMIKWVSKIRPFYVQTQNNCRPESWAEWEFYTCQANSLIAPILYAIITGKPPFTDKRIIQELHVGSIGTDALVLLLEAPE